MIREFLSCAGTRERVEFLVGTTISDWKQEELITIMNIMGIQDNTEMSAEQRVAAIEQHLADYHHQVEQRAVPQFQSMDELPARDEGQTLYQQSPVSAMAFSIKGN